MPGTVPVRERVAAYAFNRMLNMKTLDGSGLMWDLVTREPLNAVRVKQNEASIGVYDIKEKKSARTGCTYADLTILFEFFYRRKLGDTPGTELATLVSAIEREVCADQNFGGLTLDVNLVASELDLETVTDKLASGVATFVATYRHKTGDPFSLIGE
jgi:hypothetical protein